MGLKIIILIVLMSKMVLAESVSTTISGYSGLKEITQAERQKLHQHPAKFINLNHIGLKRINSHYRRIGKPELPADFIRSPEFQSTQPDFVNESNLTTLPTQVDNSQNGSIKAFPAIIGDQGLENSCVGWATTYYMMSHEVCLATLGCDNQTLGTTTSRIFSPRWTYNQINNGEDNGSYFSSAFLLVRDHGAATLSQLPYQAGDFRGWDLNALDWKTAISSRMGSVQAILINTDSGMQLVKQALVNGHVMVVGTYINSWVYKTIEANPYLGQRIVTYQNGTLGGHAMTVVGYDDSIWVDINGNGIAESAEYGAFKIANSWGKNYGNSGFIWVSYDAFRTSSLVPNFLPANRIELTQTGYVYLTPYVAYNPKLVARVTMSHLLRQQISYKFASSSNTSISPTSYLSLSAMQNTGGNYALNGSNTEVSGTFYFDITSLLTSSWDQQRFYFVPTDSTIGNPLEVRAFEVIDPTSGSVLLSSTGTPGTLDAASSIFSVGELATDTKAPTAPSNLIAKKAATISRKVNLSWGGAVDNVMVKNYLLYRNGVLLTTLNSNVLSYSDTYNLKYGITYSYSVVAVDTSSNFSSPSNSSSIRF